MSGRKQRAKRRRGRVRDDIREVTRRLVLEHGHANLTLVMIADELELTKQALYYYFDSKDTLMFEVMFESMEEEVAAIESAVTGAASGAEAVERLIRACAGHYADRLDEFRLVYLAGQVGASLEVRPDLIERIRPLNDRFYARTASLIAADQEAGLANPNLDPRRAAFAAHASVLGVLTMLGLVDAGDDAPLIHSNEDLIDHLVETHTAALRPASA